MPKQPIQADDAPAPSGGYSQAVRAGDFVYVSGQAALDAATGAVQGSSVEEQTSLTLDNVEAVLHAAGAGLEDVVKATVHLSEIDDFERFDTAYRRRMPDPKPARTTVGSALGEGLLVEIDVVAFTFTA